MQRPSLVRRGVNLIRSFVPMPAPTGPRADSRTPGLAAPNQGNLPVYGIPWMMPGFGLSWTGIYTTYRLINALPTVALVRAATRAVMKSAEWAVEETDDAPAGAADLIQSVFVKNRHRFMNEAYRCIDYGNQPFEKVWKVRKDGAVVIDRFRPLLPDNTSVVIDDAGEVIGIDNGSAKLGPSKYLYMQYDAEAGNVFGRSRLENIRNSAHRMWRDIVEKYGQYMTRTAGSLPIVYFPPGTAVDSQGATKDTGELARDVATRLSSGLAMTVPLLYDDDTIEAMKNNPEYAKVMAWRIEFLESKSDHSATFLNGLEYADKLMARGYLWPERSITEGKYGTKAEAGVHQDIAVEICYQDTCDFLTQLNEQGVDDVLEANYGEDAKGTVYLVASPLSSDSAAFMREIVKGILLDPLNADLFRTAIDFDSMLDQAGIPKSAETVEMPEREDEPVDDTGTTGTPEEDSSTAIDSSAET